ncbi:Crp/Fnr family transcriptional regulator [Limnohabitans sp. 2KL-17]|uniref:Crp/Fnr family transcriptional regulator n=1 Tax=Limnohabitans sp. 2KL-17 TaxID=1100704 RepID=UPI001E525E51|nr:Crp/Fnr family transcriptional regulator [Limnohabitans sp. 2KL-17]
MASPRSNWMINQLNYEKYEKLLPHFVLNSLEVGQWVFRPHEIIRHVYFPVSAIISMQIDTSDGFSADIVLVGKEGMVGSGVMGGNQTFSRARVKFSGLAYKLPVDIFLSELGHDSAFLKIWMAVTRQMILQIAMPTVCSSRHSNEQQVIRWILNTLDKTQGQVLQITHQEMAEILGIRRESVTMTAGKLSHEGLIEISRGQLHVLDRPQLEARACECYKAMNPVAMQ